LPRARRERVAPPAPPSPAPAAMRAGNGLAGWCERRAAAARSSERVRDARAAVGRVGVVGTREGPPSRSRTGACREAD